MRAVLGTARPTDACVSLASICGGLAAPFAGGPRAFGGRAALRTPAFPERAVGVDAWPRPARVKESCTSARKPHGIHVGWTGAAVLQSSSAIFGEAANAAATPRREARARWGFRGCPVDTGRSGRAREGVRRGGIAPEEEPKTPHRAFVQGQDAPVRVARTSPPRSRGGRLRPAGPDRERFQPNPPVDPVSARSLRPAKAGGTGPYHERIRPGPPPAPDPVRAPSSPAPRPSQSNTRLTEGETSSTSAWSDGFPTGAFAVRSNHPFARRAERESVRPVVAARPWPEAPPERRGAAPDLTDPARGAPRRAGRRGPAGRARRSRSDGRSRRRRSWRAPPPR